MYMLKGIIYEYEVKSWCTSMDEYLSLWRSLFTFGSSLLSPVWLLGSKLNILMIVVLTRGYCLQERRPGQGGQKRWRQSGYNYKDIQTLAIQILQLSYIIFNLWGEDDWKHLMFIRIPVPRGSSYTILWLLTMNLTLSLQSPAVSERFMTNGLSVWVIPVNLSDI